MSTTARPQQVVSGGWPQRARLIGGVYLLYFLTAIGGQLITSRGLVGPGSAISFAGTLLYLVLTLLFYNLFRPVNRRVAWLAVLFGLLGCANDILRSVHLAPFPLSSLIFFGPFDILIGYLIFKSTFLPRALGVLLMLAGPGWLIALTLSPASYLVVFIAAFGALAEVLLMIWLLVKGVNVQRWQEQASPGGVTHRGPGSEGAPA